MEKNNLKGWLYLLPAALFLGVFMVYPLIDVFVYSFEEGFNFASQSFFGTGTYNYAYVLRDPYFLAALKNTFILVIITVPLSTGIALLISVALSSIKTLRRFFQTVYFLPYVTNTLAVGLVFMILFRKTAYSDGLVNVIINAFGGESVDFIDGPYWAKMFVLCLYTIWIVMPFKILILTGAIASVSDTYYNAARMDGASRGRIFTKITLPMISPSLFYLVITGLQRLCRAVWDKSQCRRNEYNRRLYLRYALRRRRRVSFVCVGGGDNTLFNSADRYLHKPYGEQETRPLLVRRAL